MLRRARAALAFICTLGETQALVLILNAEIPHFVNPFSRANLSDDAYNAY